MEQLVKRAHLLILMGITKFDFIILLIGLNVSHLFMYCIVLKKTTKITIVIITDRNVEYLFFEITL